MASNLHGAARRRRWGATAVALGPVLALLAVAAPAPARSAPTDLSPTGACAQGPAPAARPSRAVAGLIGQYGEAGAVRDVSEVCGTLVLTGPGFESARLTPLGGRRYRATDTAGRSVVAAFDDGAVSLDENRLQKHDFGAETQARIRAEVHADAGGLRAAALAASPPTEPPPRRASDLVSLPALDPSIRLHTLYAGTDNFMGVRIYERAGAYLQRPAAEALVRVSAALKGRGLGLLVTDAYRPWFATKMFWDATPLADHNFVADPAQGSRHNRGCAVDLTLYDLKTGRPVEMTGRIDEMSTRSAADFKGGTSRQRWYRDRLRAEMERQGFTVYPDEWWHFDYKDWSDYGIGVATYTALASGAAR